MFDVYMVSWFLTKRGLTYMAQAASREAFGDVPIYKEVIGIIF